MAGRGGVAGREATAGEGGAGGDVCDPSALWNAITNGITRALGTCYPTDSASGLNGLLSGVVSLDEDGHVVDITGMTGARKQKWLDDLANQRWSCLAGQTIDYACTITD
jgi:hypothetical protein